jgi:hypothetical protein
MFLYREKSENSSHQLLLADALEYSDLGTCGVSNSLPR